MPAIEGLARMRRPPGRERSASRRVPISADTFSVEVARRALAAGADAVNDISGGSEEMFGLVAETRLRLRADAHRGAAAGRPALARVRRRRRPPQGLVRGESRAGPGAWRRGGADRDRPRTRLRPQPRAGPGDPAAARRAALAGAAALRLALAQGLHRRRPGRVLGGAAGRRASASGARSPRSRWPSARAPTSSASTTAARCRRCASPAASRPSGRWADRRAQCALSAHRRRGLMARWGEPAGRAPGRSRSTRRGATGGSSPRAPRPSGGRGRSRCRTRSTPASPRRCGGPASSRLYTHQLEACEAAAALQPGDHQRHRLGQEPRLQPAGARRHRPRAEAARALPLPDQGAGPGPGAQAGAAAAARAARGDLRRRHAEGGAAGDPPPQQPRPHQPGHAPRRPAAPPQELGRLPRQPRAGSSSTRPTPTAASSAPTSPTCCGGCGGWRAPTARSRASCSPRRRSPTRSSWPSGWSGRRSS